MLRAYSFLLYAADKHGVLTYITTGRVMAKGRHAAEEEVLRLHWTSFYSRTFDPMIALSEIRS